ncbi:glycerol-3-phosphate dehydrogenase [Phaeobacter sp. QD34_3]|uniref:glycerol-3-phosphate dehydrogenase n=1 Tax=unclassified Phaeobacter TaxID=2621772 RepID=UPI00237F7CF1|nr:MULTISPECIES: glycerol-3-phosphate dehydrogenase [unclassified Phaeobacter]MDE4133843.1 glycerol-3-phosphate dehydrogenase [Phaeobacter sp. QD34_3]MDE4137466.1 glycerol-3-phosphate dehydrogenase [Phaeobacter sp. QD34_24]
MTDDKITDLFIIGGGINGCGIARDAAGRGLTVSLAEMNDLASATSSASTKLFHGGLRYLEYFELRLVREALIEREVLLKAMPHISWPMRFVLPFHRDMRFDSETPTSRLLTLVMPWMKGRRPAWLIRLGLFLYDSLGKRGILPGTAKLDLTRDAAGLPLKDKFKTAFEYSDCWVEDTRLVVLNARDALARGAEIMTRTEVLVAERAEDHWVIHLKNHTTGEVFIRRAKMLVNAAGPWVADVLKQKLGQNSREGVRLVRGSHIVVPKLYEHNRCYFFQGTDGRIIFAIPYEEDFTLIGTTDADHPDPGTAPSCTPEEQDYLIDFASQYFEKPLQRADIVWTYSGVRPLYDDGASSATAATREYVLTLEKGAAPLLNVFGGKITTYRKLAESALKKIGEALPGVGHNWTAGIPLPGGDFPVGDVVKLQDQLKADYPFLTAYWARRLIRAYGTEARLILGNAKTAAALGQDFGATITARELDWSIANEWTRSGEDFLWRRTKLGLRLGESQRAAVDAYIKEKTAPQTDPAQAADPARGDRTALA